jgi:hypothetical protein
MILRSTTQVRRGAERGFFLLLRTEPSGSRSSGALPSFPLSCDPPTTRDARPRRPTRSAVNDGEGSGGGGTVEKRGAVRLSSGERKGEGKLDLREMTVR